MVLGKSMFFPKHKAYNSKRVQQLPLSGQYDVGNQQWILLTFDYNMGSLGSKFSGNNWINYKPETHLQEVNEVLTIYPVLSTLLQVQHSAATTVRHNTI